MNVELTTPPCTPLNHPPTLIWGERASDLSWFSYMGNHFPKRVASLFQYESLFLNWPWSWQPAKNSPEHLFRVKNTWSMAPFWPPTLIKGRTVLIDLKKPVS